MTRLLRTSRTARAMLAAAMMLGAAATALAQEPLEITKEFNLITSKNASGYFKPLFTTISESFNSNAFTVAKFARQWRLGLDISVCGMIIPSGELTYDAMLPEDYGKTGITETAELRGSSETRNGSGTVVQPTIYGGISTPTFSAPQTGIPPSEIPKQPSTVSYMEGNNISFMAGLPAVQLAAQFPTRTQLRFRFATVSINDASTTYFGLMLSQQFNHLVGLFADDSLIGIALNAGYHSVSRSPGIDVTSFAVGLHGSKTWQSGFSVYGGLQFEDMSGTLNFVRQPGDGQTLSKSPFLEIQRGDSLNIDVATSNNFRIGAGLAYKTGILELHADAAFASQPVLAVGLTLWFLNIDAKTRETSRLDDSYEKNSEGNKP